MKKIFAIFAVAMVAMSASAQNATALASDGIWDNWYVGVGGGVSTKTTHTKMFKNLNGLGGIKVGKWFNPRIGARIDADANMGNRPYDVTGGESWGTFVKHTDVSLMGTLNLMNIFGGYKGEPRTFEVIAAPGLGWFHSYGTSGNKFLKQNPENETLKNTFISKLALDLACNLGEKKAVQVYLEPAITYTLAGDPMHNASVGMNVDNSFVQLTAGLIYKFKTANGTHNFANLPLRDQSEIDALNAQINELKNRKPQVIEKRVEVPVEVNNTISNAATNVFFQLNSTKIADDKDKVNLDAIANAAKSSGSRVVIMGAADSQTGNPTINKKLADGRAEAVKDYLVKKGVAADKISTNGVGGVDTLSPYPLNRRALVELK